MIEKGKLPLAQIERSIITRYRKHIWRKFIKAIKEYDLIQENDRIAVAISGGKDSLLMAKLFQELHKHGVSNFDLEFIAMDPGYDVADKDNLIDNCRYLDIPIHVFESGIFDITSKIAEDYPCYMCARMRRGALYGKAKELECNKLALGHHFNDIIETTLLNLLCSGNFKTMMPKLKSENHIGIELIRPLYLIEEEYIKRFIKYTGLRPLDCACSVEVKNIGSKRNDIKELVAELKGRFVNVDMSIFRAAENVNLDGVLAWKQGEKKHSFLDSY